MSQTSFLLTTMSSTSKRKTYGPYQVTLNVALYHLDVILSHPNTVRSIATQLNKHPQHTEYAESSTLECPLLLFPPNMLLPTQSGNMRLLFVRSSPMLKILELIQSSCLAFSGKCCTIAWRLAVSRQQRRFAVCHRRRPARWCNDVARESWTIFPRRFTALFLPVRSNYGRFRAQLVWTAAVYSRWGNYYNILPSRLC